MEYSFIIAVIPVILVVAFLVWIAKKITDGERLDMKEGVLGVVILMVAVLIMVPMVSSTQVYTWDDDTGELVIQQNISGGSYAWDTYDSQIRSIVIKPGVTQIGNSAFDGATNLEYLSIPDSVTDIGANAFGVALKDYLDQTISSPEAGEYVGAGDGTLYLFDDSIFTYRDNNTAIAGLMAAASDAVNIVIPNEYSGTKITGIGYQAFKDKTALTRCLTLPGSNLKTTGNGSFSGCSSLAVVSLPEGFQTISVNTFYGCSSLEAISLPSTLTSINGQAFYDSGIVSLTIPEGVTTIANSVFNGCTALETISLPSTLTSVGTSCFYRCTAITDVTFASGFAAELQSSAFSSWTFYASDGTTVIDKTVASNLAGKTFQGTASALVEVEPGQLTLTPQQIQQVHLHDAELQDLKDQISIDPLPLQPSLQEQELTA